MFILTPPVNNGQINDVTVLLVWCPRCEVYTADSLFSHFSIMAAGSCAANFSV